MRPPHQRLAKKVAPSKSPAPLPIDNERYLNELLRDISLFMGREVEYCILVSGPAKKGAPKDFFQLFFVSFIFAQNEQKMGFRAFKNVHCQKSAPSMNPLR